MNDNTTPLTCRPYTMLKAVIILKIRVLKESLDAQRKFLVVFIHGSLLSEYKDWLEILNRNEICFILFESMKYNIYQVQESRVFSFNISDIVPNLETIIIIEG